MDFILRLQHTIDHPKIHKIVEVGFGDFGVISEIYLSDKSYVYLGYELPNRPFTGTPTSIVDFKNIKKV